MIYVFVLYCICDIVVCLYTILLLYYIVRWAARRPASGSAGGIFGWQVPTNAQSPEGLDPLLPGQRDRKWGVGKLGDSYGQLASWSAGGVLFVALG